MNVKISSSVGKTYSNTKSCTDLVRYLEKENDLKKSEEKEFFFSHENDMVRADEVIEIIDKAGKKQLGKDDDKFYHISISPSGKEQAHFNRNPEALKEYTRACMDKYAENFGKGLKGSDLIYFAKVEQERHHKGTDEEVKAGEKKTGELKDGDNMHVHIIVSRKTADHKKKISPLTNHKNTEKGTVKGGFDRKEFYTQCEKQFDKQFNYQRPKEETFEYCNIMKNGTAQEKAAETLKLEELQKQAEQKKAPELLKEELKTPEIKEETTIKQEQPKRKIGFKL